MATEMAHVANRGMNGWTDRWIETKVLTFSSFGGSVTVTLFINSFSVCTSPPSLSQCQSLCISLSASLTHTCTHLSDLPPLRLRRKWFLAVLKFLIIVCVCNSFLFLCSPLAFPSTDYNIYICIRMCVVCWWCYLYLYSPVIHADCQPENKGI